MILIVDDTIDSGEAFCRLLRRQGYPCECVASGREALAYIRAQSPEQPLLVVLDQMMPEISGIETLEQIRADPRIKQTNVIMFSAVFDAALRDEAITLGAAAWLLKGGGYDAGIDRVLNTIVQWYERVGGAKQQQQQQQQHSK
jgi:CheY-like chemotaxis protein